SEDHRWKMTYDDCLEDPPWFQHMSYGADIAKLPWMREQRKLQAVIRKEASWQRMYPTQPPPRSMDVHQIDLVVFEFHEFGQMTGAEGELRMDVLYDLVQESARSNNIRIYWRLLDPLWNAEIHRF